jgi:hypothetical protein
LRLLRGAFCVVFLGCDHHDLGQRDLRGAVGSKRWVAGLVPAAVLSRLAKQLKATISTYDSAVQSGDSQQVADAAGALAAEIRADAHLATIPRLYGCYNPKVLAGLQKATDTLATTLDALSCAGVNMCNRNQAEVPRLLPQEKPQERTYVEAINTYAA